jgi:carbon monoxide dehydrogenase subunit G
VLRSKKGRSVRADFHVVESARPKLMRWAQDIPGTPFERFLTENVTSVELTPVDGGTEVTVTARQKLRGASRVGGGVLLKRATKKQLDEALDSLAGLVAP